MPQLVYTPQALEDLQQIRTNLRSQFGAETAKKRMRHLTQTLRNLERFPKMASALKRRFWFPLITSVSSYSQITFSTVLIQMQFTLSVY